MEQQQALRKELQTAVVEAFGSGQRAAIMLGRPGSTGQGWEKSKKGIDLELLPILMDHCGERVQLLRQELEKAERGYQQMKRIAEVVHEQTGSRLNDN